MSKAFGPVPEGSKCHYCPDPATTWDHIVPRVQKGPNALWNRVPCCDSCNQIKADFMPTCPCLVCETARERWEETERTRPPTRRSFGPPDPVEIRHGLPVENQRQLEAWIARTEHMS